VLFRNATQSGCGIATSEVGPHYCPLDKTIYLDETFFDVLAERLGGSNGDVAQAYVMAHEVGHHVQNVTGIMERVQTTPPTNKLAAIACQYGSSYRQIVMPDYGRIQ
jgi:predicted metalloprotease